MAPVKVILWTAPIPLYKGTVAGDTSPIFDSSQPSGGSTPDFTLLATTQTKLLAGWLHSSRKEFPKINVCFSSNRPVYNPESGHGECPLRLVIIVGTSWLWSLTCDEWLVLATLVTVGYQPFSRSYRCCTINNWVWVIIGDRCRNQQLMVIEDPKLRRMPPTFF